MDYIYDKSIEKLSSCWKEVFVVVATLNITFEMNYFYDVSIEKLGSS
jgi:hypothetical protein